MSADAQDHSKSQHLRIALLHSVHWGDSQSQIFEAVVVFMYVLYILSADD